jgi:DnaJ family protein C protein 7
MSIFRYFFPFCSSQFSLTHTHPLHPSPSSHPSMSEPMDTETEVDTTPASPTPEEQAVTFKAEGNERYKAKDYKGAIALYTKAIQLDSSNPAYYGNRAASHLMVMNYKEANTDCDTILSLEPTNSKAFSRKVTALKGLGKYDEALEVINKGLVFDPNNAAALKDRDSLQNAKLQLSNVEQMIANKQYRFALPKVDTLLRDMGSGSRVLNHLRIKCLIELDRLEEAMNLSNTVLRQAQQGDVDLLLLRAQCLYKMSDLENAIKHLQQVRTGVLQ